MEGLEGSLTQIQASRATRNHFVFGDLSPTQWLQFAVIHHNHHQKIIRDVLEGVRPVLSERPARPVL